MRARVAGRPRKLSVPWVSAGAGLAIAGLLFGSLVAGGVIHVGAESSPPTTSEFRVLFVESGLVDRAAFLPTWSVTLDGATVVSQRAVITFLEPNGTYSFTIGSIPGYVASVAYGEVVVSDWNPTVYVTFEPIGPNMHLVTFGETTLPPGFAWSVTLNGTTLWGGTGASSRLTFPELNGTYGFTVGPVAGWSSHPSEGSLNVAGNDVTQVIAFTRG